MCVCVCVYIHIYINIYINIHVYIYIYIGVRNRLSTECLSKHPLELQYVNDVNNNPQELHTGKGQPHLSSHGAANPVSRGDDTFTPMILALGAILDRAAQALSCATRIWA